MSDFGTMKTRLKRELAREGLTVDIQHAIADAIEFYSSERFDFNYLSKEVTLASADLAYSLSTNIMEVERFELSSTGTHITLAQEDWQKVRDSQFDGLQAGGTANKGAPISFAVYQGQAHFDVALDKNYEARIWFKADLQEVSASSTDGATNAWMTHGERMIREKAKQFIYEDRLKNITKAALHDLRAEGVRRMLKKRIFTSDNITPTEY